MHMIIAQMFSLLLSTECSALIVSERALTVDYKSAISHFDTKCKVDNFDFELHLGAEKTSEDEEKEFKEFGYPYFWIKLKNGQLMTALSPKEHNEILFLDKAEKSVCSDTLAFKQLDGSVAIFFRQNNRPFEDKLGVVFFAPAQNKILATERELGVSSKVIQVDKAMAFAVHDSPTDVETFTVKVKGKESQTTEEVLEYWNSIRRDKSKVKVAADAQMTWQKSIYKSYFKSQVDFENAFGWNNNKKIFARQWVYHVKDPDCIHASTDRIASNENWHCRIFKK